MKKNIQSFLILIVSVIIYNLTCCNNRNYSNKYVFEEQLQYLTQDYIKRYKEKIKLEKDDQDKSFNFNMYFFSNYEQSFLIIEGNPFYPFFFVNYNDSSDVKVQVDQKYCFSSTIADNYCSFYFEDDSIMSLFDVSGINSIGYDSLRINDYIIKHSFNFYHPLFIIYKQKQDNSWEYYGMGVNGNLLNYPSYFIDNWVVSDELKQLLLDLNI